MIAEVWARDRRGAIRCLSRHRSLAAARTAAQAAQRDNAIVVYGDLAVTSVEKMRAALAVPVQPRR